MPQNTKNTLLKTVQTAMLCALAVVFMLVIRFPLLPGAQFLEYDMGDLPVILATLLLGPGSGTVALLLVSLVQALTVSAAAGWEGFLMHFLASESFLLTLYFITKKTKNAKKILLGFVCATAVMTVFMIPLNLIFTPLYLHTSVQAVLELILPAILPFNLLKGVINSVIGFALYFPLVKILTKSHLLPKNTKSDGKQQKSS